ncbi:MAG: MurR/RpiR family transcriptional regulator [Alphaproteobacteria bacterium]|nr:MurR/RpiR family transcriptional regulator [Alphaproteobacteria bacterium]
MSANYETGAGQTRTAAHLLNSLREMFDLLSPQLQRGASYILERPDEVAFTSMRQLAQRADVQPATMVRLAQKLGLDGYEALRDPFRDELRKQPSGYGRRARQLQERTGRRSGGRALTHLAGEMISADRENLSVTLQAVGGDGLAATSTVLAKARRFYIIGMRSLFPAAFYTHYACSLFRENTILLDGAGGTHADGLRGISDQDAVLIFSLEPYSSSVVQAASYAVERGADVIAVTDSLVSPLAALTPHLLLVGTDGPAIFKSIVPAMAVAQTLVAQMLAQGGQSALDAVAESELQLDRFETYWPAGKQPEFLVGEGSADMSQEPAEPKYQEAQKFRLPRK